jgi:hypothetical protein
MSPTHSSPRRTSNTSIGVLDIDACVGEIFDITCKGITRLHNSGSSTTTDPDCEFVSKDHGPPIGPARSFASFKRYALTGDNVDFERGTMFIRRTLEEISQKQRIKVTTITHSRWRIILARRTVAASEAHCERMRAEGRDGDRATVLLNTHGGCFRQVNVNNQTLRPLLKKAGLPAISPYDLRRSSTTIVLQQGAKVQVVSERLGP